MNMLVVEAMAEDIDQFRGSVGLTFCGEKPAGKRNGRLELWKWGAK